MQTVLGSVGGALGVAVRIGGILAALARRYIISDDRGLGVQVSSWENPESRVTPSWPA